MAGREVLPDKISRLATASAQLLKVLKSGDRIVADFVVLVTIAVSTPGISCEKVTRPQNH